METNKKFCLLHEPWIRVINEKADMKEISLLELFRNAQSYKELAGEIVMQNMAMMRFLLAITNTVLLRYDDTGNKKEWNSSDDILDHFEEIWNKGELPYLAFEKYLEEWKNCFWLIHPDTPFYQVPSSFWKDKGTRCSAAKLNGELFESNNKVQLFGGRSGEKKKELSLPEAARWLVFLMSFDDCAAKKPRPKECWTSKLGLTIAKGRNLFETLLINSMLLKPDGDCWNTNVPTWETINHTQDKMVKIPKPLGPAELFTIQSRRITLEVSSDDVVTGYEIAAGDYFDDDNYFTEPMTLWKCVQGQKNEQEHWIPRQYDPGKQIWREFGSIIDTGQAESAPGIIAWINTLQDPEYGVIDNNILITFEICSVYYGGGTQKCSISKDVHDQLTFHAGVINKMNLKWQVMIKDMVHITEDVAKEVAKLAYRIRMSSSGSDGLKGAEEQEQFYYHIDPLFREWLYSLICNDEQELHESRGKWCSMLKKEALIFAHEIVIQSSSTAFVGRNVMTEIKGIKSVKHYSVPEAFNHFIYRINTLLDEGGK